MTEGRFLLIQATYYQEPRPVTDLSILLQQIFPYDQNISEKVNSLEE